MNLPKVFIDRPIPEGLEGLFEGRVELVGPDLSAMVEAVAALAGAARWDGERMDHGPNLKIVSRTGIGYDAVDLAAATERGIVACNAPDSPTISTAEHAVALMMHAAKSLGANQGRLRREEGDYFTATAAIELADRTLGLVGYGRIARRVARVAKALEMEVIATDPVVVAGDLDPADSVELVSFGDLLGRSDVVSAHCPPPSDGSFIFDASAFAAMKPGVIFINTARGALVDQDALVAALDRGQVGSAGLDVTVPEPFPGDHRLQQRDDVIITPHIASATDLGKRRLFSHALENVMTCLAGERVPTCVNPEVYE